MRLKYAGLRFQCGWKWLVGTCFPVPHHCRITSSSSPCSYIGDRLGHVQMYSELMTSTIRHTNIYCPISTDKLGIPCRRVQSAVVTFLTMMSWSFDQSQWRGDSRWRQRHLLLVFWQNRVICGCLCNFSNRFSRSPHRILYHDIRFFKNCFSVLLTNSPNNKSYSTIFTTNFVYSEWMAGHAEVCYKLPQLYFFNISNLLVFHGTTWITSIKGAFETNNEFCTNIFVFPSICSCILWCNKRFICPRSHCTRLQVNSSAAFHLQKTYH